ncbi:hypothetical protein CHS0354_014129 [Potamilus streckersoni]|uniref:Uncharacterized protein n=1 Tax=Potamilus streckersoni TaxID=2493646 RepID=A0AAE0TKS9_9BIVA|nr:hypothetical protein CHS0354_014129 [Potamilus streckersoni]
MPRSGASCISWIAKMSVFSAMLGFLPIFVHCDSCIKTSSCSCVCENGSYIDLSPLNSGGLYPRFKDVIEVTGGAWDSWNPCGMFSEGSCYNVAVSCDKI